MVYGNRTGSAPGHGYDGYQQHPQQAQTQGYGAQAGYEQYPAQASYDQHVVSQSYPYQQQHETVEPCELASLHRFDLESVELIVDPLIRTRR